MPSMAFYSLSIVRKKQCAVNVLLLFAHVETVRPIQQVSESLLTLEVMECLPLSFFGERLQVLVANHIVFQDFISTTGVQS